MLCVLWRVMSSCLVFSYLDFDLLRLDFIRFGVLPSVCACRETEERELCCVGPVIDWQRPCMALVCAAVDVIGVMRVDVL